MSTVLELKNVSKTIGKKKIIDNISFSIKPGEIFGFLGPNGAGKTTTIKMITGLINIGEGDIFICGKNIKEDFESAMSNVGGIIENPEMYGYMSGRKNLKIYARMHGNISENRIDEVIKMVKLENRIDEKVKRYSLGMRQRLGLAQAMLHNPKLLILDEPTNGLDPMGIKELRDNLRNLAETEGVSVLVSSHLLSEMELMCDRFGIIDGGKIIDIKTLNELIHDDKSNINNYILDVNNLDDAIEIIKNINKNIDIKIENMKLHFSCTRSDSGKIISELVLNNVLVYEMSLVAKSLEDEFLKITKGSKNQIV
ncbi:putative ABC transporter ATP-binding protein [Clostridium bornimense]|uniref:Putative ABC transporter ATP-binding protein n=1 Tax=Clostridium bornimense TaxID=1216932 RepID=W6S3H5_9CLOT|nr:ABC transporter ATP-binding protein [Clostridium bornimense]CDM70454.1 putative ABC transporter ATP-binding protein [Clostridium bornimense]